MSDTKNTITELMQGKGYHCSQSIMQLSLDKRGIQNEGLIRALGGLGGGMSTRRTCGALIGGVCVLSSYCPRPEGQPEPTLYKEMSKELVEWFVQSYGSTECGDIVEYDRSKILAFCPQMIEKTFEKCMQILEKQGIDPCK